MLHDYILKKKHLAVSKVTNKPLLLLKIYFNINFFTGIKQILVLMLQYFGPIYPIKRAENATCAHAYNRVFVTKYFEVNIA